MKALWTHPRFERNEENQWMLANEDGIPMLATLFGTTSTALATYWVSKAGGNYIALYFIV
ncbi:MAG: hypothetical protein HEQ32_04745 [Vampirovibrio sp.]|jgi:hypothetical protein